MTTIEQYEGLSAAYKLLTATRRSLHAEPLVVWSLVSHAQDHINNQIRAMLLHDAAEQAVSDGN